MKKKISLFILATFICLFSSCKLIDKLVTWPVATGSGYYADFIANGNEALKDKGVRKERLSSYNYDYLVASSTRKDMNKEEIRNWFIDHGLSTSQADDCVAWVVDKTHARVIIRNGERVNILIK